MTTGPLHLSEAHAVLIGTGHHADGSALTDVPAVARTIEAVAEVLVERCGMGQDKIVTVIDPSTAGTMGDAVGAAVEQATDVLLVYYVGHGLVSQDGVLHLAACTTDVRPTRLKHTALPFATIRDYLRETSARLVVILDCCFSGRAVGALGDAAGEVADLAQVKGGYVLTSAGRDELALAAPGARYTAFSGALLELLRAGHAEWPELLTLHDVYRYLAQALPGQGAPRPRVRYDGNIGDLVLARNPLPRPVAPAVLSPVTPALPVRRIDICPYKGMAAFEEADAGWFFGRERLTTFLVGRLADQYDDAGLLVVTGASGAGKSSLVHAGLLPALARGSLGIAGSSNWPRLVLTPTADPLGALAETTRLGDDASAISCTELASDAYRLRDSLRAQQETDRVVLVVDQFEELFTLCADHDVREAFVNALLVAAHGGGGAPTALVVLAVRADFFGQCAAFRQLVPALQGRQVVVGPMAPAELRDAIERPARGAGLSLEPGLTELLLHEMNADRSYEPGQLPLLSHTLLVTCQQRTTNTLTVADYRNTGGIPEAVARTAEAAFDRLDDRGKDMARRLLLRLVHIGDNTEDTRRRADRDHLLDELPDPSLAAKVLHAFAEPGTRLLTVDGDTVQITHDSLLRAWPRLQAWIEENRSGLLLQQRLVEAARAWATEGHDPAALYHGNRLALAREWAEQQLGELGTVTREFLDASVAREQAEQLAMARRARRRLQLAVVLALLLVVAIVAATAAIHQQGVADDQRRIAVGRGLLAQADAASRDRPRLSLMLGVAALRTDANENARARLVDTLTNSPYIGTLIGHRTRVTATAFRPDGRLVATGAEDATMILWDVTDIDRPRRRATLTGHPGPVVSLAFSPDGRTLAAGSAQGDSTVTMWDVSTVAHPRRLTTVDGQRADQYGAWTVAFSPDGRLLAVAEGNQILEGNVHLWDVTRLDQPRRLASTHLGQVWSVGQIWSVAFTTDGTTLAVGMDSEQHPLVLLDITDPVHPRKSAEAIGHHRTLPSNESGVHNIEVFDVAFNPDDSLLATAGRDRTAILWDTTDKQHPRQIATLGGHNGLVRAVTFGPGGRSLVTRSDDGTAAVWDLTDPTRPVRSTTLTGQSGSWRTMALSPDGRVLITSADDNTAAIWRVDGETETTQVSRSATLDQPGATGVAAFSPDGRTLATGSSMGDTASLWDITEPQRPVRLANLTRDGEPVPDVDALAITPDNHTLITSDLTATPQVWDISNREQPRPIATLQGHKTSVTALEVNTDGDLAVTGSWDTTTKLWDISNRRAPRVIATLTTRVDVVHAFAFSPDGRLLATAAIGNRILLWDITRPDQPNQVATLEGHQAPVTDLMFQPGDAVLASGSWDHTTALWDVTDPAHAHWITSLPGHTDAVQAVAFSPDGTTIATGSSDHSVVLWDVTDHTKPTQLIVLSGHTDTVEGLAFSPDGTNLVSAGGMADRHVIVWNLGERTRITTDPVRRACSIAGRGLSPQEWDRYANGVPYQQTCP